MARRKKARRPRDGKSPSSLELRCFGWAAALVLVFVASKAGKSPPAFWLHAAAGVTFALGTLWPRSLRGAYVIVRKVTYPPRWLLQTGMLGAIYFGLLTPLAIFFRMRGRDLLRLRNEPEELSYWETRQGVSGPEQYLRQY